MKHNWLLGTGLIALTLGNLPAMAQEAQPATTADAAEEASVQELVVTGSRIVASGVAAPTPVTVLDSTKMLQLAPAALDDVISQLPAFRNNSGPNQVQRNAGSTTTGQSIANLRGLGGARTLTLVDGRRMVPTNPSATTSTAIIPLGLVKRMEVVTGGASAAYGSDAVAGVVNFILADRLEGVRGSIYGGISEHGDNEEVGANIAFGINGAGDRLRLVVGVDYNKNWGVGNIYSRPWSAVQPGNSGNPISFGASRPAGTAAFGWANGVQFANQTPGGVINSATTLTGAASTVLNQLTFNPDGTTSPLVRGPVFGNLMINSNSNPIATPMAQWNLKQPLEQLASMARISFDVSETMTLFADVNYARSRVVTFSQHHQAAAITIRADNPFLPAGIRAQMTANNIASFNMGRVNTDWLGTSADNTYQSAQGVIGVKGSIFDKFRWDASFTHGRSTVDAQVYSTREANLSAALFAVRDSSGNVVCGPIASNPNFAPNRLTNSVQPGNVLPGCVPMNPFGVGNVTDAVRDYVSGFQPTEITMDRTVAAVNLSGPLFRLPGGNAQIAVGAEARWDGLDQVADDLQIRGLYSAGNNRSYSGRERVQEAYAEIELPILDQISLNGAIRRTNYRQSGSVTTWKVGGTLEPLEGLRLRATRSRDIRAPSLSDLFLLGGVSATGSFVNPFNGQSDRLPVQTTGNAALRPETADTFTAGITYEGHNALAGLRLSLDYYRIKVKDVIATVGATDVLARCFGGQQIYCSAITFDNSPFGIAKIFVQPFNQSLLDVEGVDAEIGYRTRLAGVGLPGEIDASMFISWLRHYRSTDLAGPGGTTLDFAGYQNSAPKQTASAFLSYHLDPITIGLQMRAFSSISYSPLFFGPGEAGYNPALSTSINKNRFEPQAMFNLNLAYDLKIAGRKVQLFGNVANLTNRNPPEFAIAAINLGGNPYDYVGRSYKFGLRFEM